MTKTLPQTTHRPLGTLVIATLLGVLNAISSAATTNLWSYEIKFDAAHGFDSVPTPADIEGRAGSTKPGGGTWTGQSTRTYDIVKSNGTGGYQTGADGTNDVTITTRVLSNTALSGSWKRLNATIESNNGLGVNAAMDSGTSRPNDYGVVAYTVSFNSALSVTAKDLSMRLSNVNGDGEIYEWAMVTLGDVGDAPFTASSIGTYKNTDYSNFANSSYYNADGSVKLGGTATGQALPTGKTMTQYLAGEPAGSRDYLNPDGTLNNRGLHVVGDGWVALDNFMTKISDSAPSDSNTAPPINPKNYASNYEDEVDVTGASLGMGELETVDTFTIWLGYTDVATAKANGFSRTNADMFGYVSNVKIGSSIAEIPEPATATVGVLAALFLVTRRRRGA